MMFLHEGKIVSTAPALIPMMLMILLSFCVIEIFLELPPCAHTTKTSANADQETPPAILAQNPASRICHGRGTQRS